MRLDRAGRPVECHPCAGPVSLSRRRSRSETGLHRGRSRGGPCRCRRAAGAAAGTQVDEPVDRPHQVVGWPMPLQVEAVEERPLRRGPLSHHRPVSTQPGRLNQPRTTSSRRTFSTASARSSRNRPTVSRQTQTLRNLSQRARSGHFNLGRLRPGLNGRASRQLTRRRCQERQPAGTGGDLRWHSRGNRPSVPGIRGWRKQP